jgi:hypothetical protein
MAIDICTFPSVSPPTILDNKNTRKLLEKIHNNIETALPICINDEHFVIFVTIFVKKKEN